LILFKDKAKLREKKGVYTVQMTIWARSQHHLWAKEIYCIGLTLFPPRRIDILHLRSIIHAELRSRYMLDGG